MKALIVVVIAFAQLAHAEPEPRCAKAAIAQAGKLLFDVLEVAGHIYMGTYRMRLIYARDLPDQCVLMGQEILELAKL